MRKIGRAVIVLGRGFRGVFARESDAETSRVKHLTITTDAKAARYRIKPFVLSRALRDKENPSSSADPHGNGSWVKSLDGVPRVLYRLPELLAGRRQNQTGLDCRRRKERRQCLASLDPPATTNSGGSNAQWLDEIPLPCGIAKSSSFPTMMHQAISTL